MADLRLTVSVDPRGLQAVVLDEIARVLSQAFRAAASGVHGRVGVIATEAVRNSPEYQSLLDGKLRGASWAWWPPTRSSRRSTERTRRGGLGHPLGVPAGRAQGRGRAAGRDAQGRLLGGPVRPRRPVRVRGRVRRRVAAVAHPGGRPGHRGRLPLRRPGFPDRSRTGMGVMAPAGRGGSRPSSAGPPADNWLTRALGGLGPRSNSSSRTNSPRCLS
jgi:hypothetical protein